MPPDIRKPLKAFRRILLDARDEGLNEADTVQRLVRFFEDVLGFDGLRDISREAEMKGKYVDVCLKIDGRIRLLVEAKAAGVRLRDKHIDQAQAYASRNNYRWVLLTNAIDWNLYHLTFDEGIEYEKAFAVSVDEDAEFDEAAAKLALLHKKSIAKGELDAFWVKSTALAAASIGHALFNEDVLNLLRREIRKDTGVLIDVDDLAKSLHEMLSVESREQVGRLKVRRRRKATRREPANKAAAPEAPAKQLPSG